MLTHYFVIRNMMLILVVVWREMIVWVVCSHGV